MRRLIVNEEQFKALQFAVSDVAEVYSTFKTNGGDGDENEQEYEKQVRRYGEVLTGLYNKEFKE